jgi:hypothetical protein
MRSQMDLLKRSLQEGFRLESWRCNLSHELGFEIPKPVLPDRKRSRQEYERLTSIPSWLRRDRCRKGPKHFLPAPQPMQQHG